jgi:two-component system sensor histidine kinase BaeS
VTGRHRHGPPHWARYRRGPGRWPPGGPPRYGAPFWQRRFLRFAVAATVIWILAGIAFGYMFDEPRDGSRGGPPPQVVIPLVVGVAVLATVLAYRRIARPVSRLLGGAARIGDGDYSTRVRPDGPRSVQALGRAFNDMATRLEQSEVARRRFLADVTHELRTPLTVLQAGIEAQLDGVHQRDDEHLNTLLEQTRTVNRLVDDLRTLALGDAGQLTVTLEPTSLNEVVDDAVSSMQAAARGRSVTIVAHADSPVEQDADGTRLVQVLTNLLTNAVRHTPRDGTVTVSLASAEPGAVITVDDTGPGIDSDPEMLFDRFHRAADSGGSGLGLTIARQLVEAHGGTVTASNRPATSADPGGARFTVVLPSGDVLA